MHKKYIWQICKIDKYICNMKEKNYEFKTIDLVNINKSPRLIRTLDLRFTSPMLYILNYNNI